MTDRKETPDVLAELLGDQQPSSSQVLPTPQKTSFPKPKTKTSPRSSPRPSTTERRKSANPKWEYQVVSFQYYNGWRSRFVNGEEVADWMDSPLIHETISQMGDQGWEIVAAGSGERMYGFSDNQQLFFKRKKP